VADAINARFFQQPHWLILARGMNVEDWLEHDVLHGTGGISFPTPVHLSVGNRYYRFASSATSKDVQVGGSWWIEFDQFHKIKTYAKQNGHSLSYAARLFLALPYDWTRVDRLVSAILEAPLKAYAGKGKVASGNANVSNNVWTPIQRYAAIQLYIPGLFIKGHNPPLHTVAFPEPRLEFIRESRHET
jgi:hypothetical protein